MQVKLLDCSCEPSFPLTLDKPLSGMNLEFCTSSKISQNELRVASSPGSLHGTGEREPGNAASTITNHESIV